MESTFLNIPDNLRPTYFFTFSMGFYPVLTRINIMSLNFSQKNEPRQILKGLK